MSADPLHWPHPRQYHAQVYEVVAVCGFTYIKPEYAGLMAAGRPAFSERFARTREEITCELCLDTIMLDGQRRLRGAT